ncbi:hypothetical protein ABZW18_24295 [Streptomyces sp. NPDC004647]|uniref:hypothetical protein n=1 Tax=Streptomyces sp. NPDC004647 TaxID=3154671 RepID=UPI0033A67AB1
MSDIPGSGSIRSAADLVNEQIRALWAHTGGGRLSVEERREYERLVVQWAEAMRSEVVEAA